MFKYLLLTLSVVTIPNSAHGNDWLLIDNFETNNLNHWHIVDTQNNTKPFVPKPQVTEIRQERGNNYLIKKPAEDGIVGNRKALSFTALPHSVEVGQVATFFLRLQVERFPNNHAFGISNLHPEGIEKQAYNAFEPTLRVTDKYESNGFKNNGALMVKVDSEDKYRQYANIQNYENNRSASPLKPGIWYSIWYVVNNAVKEHGGQSYEVYIKGGEFEHQSLVYQKADFRMKREQPLTYFFATTNTGPMKKPYGNGGLLYDDLYMSLGVNLSQPIVEKEKTP